MSLDAFLVALRFMQVDDVDIDEVQCLLANLIYMVRGRELLCGRLSWNARGLSRCRAAQRAGGAVGGSGPRDPPHPSCRVCLCLVLLVLIA